MISLPLRKRALATSAVWLVPACVWAHLDAIGSSGVPPDAETFDAPAESEMLETSSESEAPDAPPDSLDVNVTPPETSAGDDVAVSSPCAAAAASVRQWSFDSNSEGWTTVTDPGTTASLSWTGTMGNPPGALQFDVTPGARKGAWLKYTAPPLGDLTHRFASAWVWLDSGASPQLKLFAQTGATFAWADSGTVLLLPRAWTCVSLDLSAPSYNQPNYDPTNVVSLGFETQGATPFRLYVDDVRYY